MGVFNTDIQRIEARDWVKNHLFRVVHNQILQCSYSDYLAYKNFNDYDLWYTKDLKIGTRGHDLQRQFPDTELHAGIQLWIDEPLPSYVVFAEEFSRFSLYTTARELDLRGMPRKVNNFMYIGGPNLERIFWPELEEVVPWVAPETANIYNSFVIDAPHLKDAHFPNLNFVGTLRVKASKDLQIILPGRVRHLITHIEGSVDEQRKAVEDHFDRQFYFEKFSCTSYPLTVSL